MPDLLTVRVQPGQVGLDVAQQLMSLLVEEGAVQIDQAAEQLLDRELAAVESQLVRRRPGVR